MKCLFQLAVWGDEYVGNFLNIALPTLMAPGNLPTKLKSADSTFRIYITESGRESLLNSPLFVSMQNVINVELIDIEYPRQTNKFSSLNDFQVDALCSSYSYETVFFVYPDFVWADGSITKIIERLNEGHKAFLCVIPRIEKESYVEEFADRYKEQLTAHESISIAPRDFVRQCDKHFHKIMETYDPDGDEFSRFPSQLSWKIPNSGRLFHCYHQHPIAISVDPMNLEYLYRFRTSLDEDYISSLFSTLSHVYLCKDSDEVAVCSLSEREFWIETVSPSQIDTRMVIWRWAERYASLIHRSFVRIPYTWHWDDVPDHLWSSVEEKANQIIGDIAELLYLPDSCIKVEDMIATRNRELRIKQMKSKRSYGIGSSNFNPNDPAIDIHPISIPKKLAYKFFTLIHMFIMSKPFETGFLYTLRTETVAILKRTPFIRPIWVKYTEQSRTVEAHAWTRWHTNYTSKNRDNGKN